MTPRQTAQITSKKTSMKRIHTTNHSSKRKGNTNLKWRHQNKQREANTNNVSGNYGSTMIPKQAARNYQYLKSVRKATKSQQQKTETPTWNGDTKKKRKYIEGKKQKKQKRKRAQARGSKSTSTWKQEHKQEHRRKKARTITRKQYSTNYTMQHQL